VTFFYARTGDSQSVKDFLGDNLRRTVQCDGTSLTSFLERAGGKRPGCWSHGRRRFVACARGGDACAVVALRMIRRLFAVERLSARLGETPDERLRRRLEDSAPVLDDLRAWLDEQRAQTPPKTALGKALGYLHRQWHRLVLFLTDGRIELTNNRVERELRSLVIGRNYAQISVMQRACPE
jgi:transposase